MTCIDGGWNALLGVPLSLYTGERRYTNVVCFVSDEDDDDDVVSFPFCRCSFLFLIPS